MSEHRAAVCRIWDSHYSKLGAIRGRCKDCGAAIAISPWTVGQIARYQLKAICDSCSHGFVQQIPEEDVLFAIIPPADVIRDANEEKGG